MSDLRVAPTVEAKTAQAARVEPMPTLVLGGSGYVAGELLRLIAGHPQLRAAAVFSDSKPGVSVDEVFPHLAGAFDGLTFSGREALPRIVGEHPRLAVLGAAPHGATASLLAELLDEAARAGSDLSIVDLSADFRFADASAWESVYGHAHGAPELHRRVSVRGAGARAEGGACARGAGARDRAPGLFHDGGAARLRAALARRARRAERHRRRGDRQHRRRADANADDAPSGAAQHALRLLAARAPASAGDGGAGRRGGRAGAVPLRAAVGAVRARHPRDAGDAARGRRDRRGRACRACRASMPTAPFVDVLAAPPRLQDVVGTNRCRLAVAADAETLVVFSAIDNLVKGAAGGGIQWMNRLLGYDETAGLTTPGLGWL